MNSSHSSTNPSNQRPEIVAIPGKRQISLGAVLNKILEYDAGRTWIHIEKPRMQYLRLFLERIVNDDLAGQIQNPSAKDFFAWVNKRDQQHRFNDVYSRTLVALNKQRFSFPQFFHWAFQQKALNKCVPADLFVEELYLGKKDVNSALIFCRIINAVKEQKTKLKDETINVAYSYLILSRSLTVATRQVITKPTNVKRPLSLSKGLVVLLENKLFLPDNVRVLEHFVNTPIGIEKVAFFMMFLHKNGMLNPAARTALTTPNLIKDPAVLESESIRKRIASGLEPLQQLLGLTVEGIQEQKEVAAEAERPQSQAQAQAPGPAEPLRPVEDSLLGEAAVSIHGDGSENLQGKKENFEESTAVPDVEAKQVEVVTAVKRFDNQLSAELLKLVVQDSDEVYDEYFHMQQILYFVEKGANPDAEDRDGNTVVNLLSQFNSDFLQEFIEVAQPQFTNKPNHQGKSPLWYRVDDTSYNKCYLVFLLLDKAKSEATFPSKEFPFIHLLEIMHRMEHRQVLGSTEGYNKLVYLLRAGEDLTTPENKAAIKIFLEGGKLTSYTMAYQLLLANADFEPLRATNLILFDHLNRIKDQLRNLATSLPSKEPIHLQQWFPDLYSMMHSLHQEEKNWDNVQQQISRGSLKNLPKSTVAWALLHLEEPTKPWINYFSKLVKGLAEQTILMGVNPPKPSFSPKTPLEQKGFFSPQIALTAEEKLLVQALINFGFTKKEEISSLDKQKTQAKFIPRARSKHPDKLGVGKSAEGAAFTQLNDDRDRILNWVAQGRQNVGAVVTVFELELLKQKEQMKMQPPSQRASVAPAP